MTNLCLVIVLLAVSNAFFAGSELTPRSILRFLGAIAYAMSKDYLYGRDFNKSERPGFIARIECGQDPQRQQIQS